MPPKLLKAAALIAYHQPMPQSRLVELLGQKAYDYVRELAQHGMIDRRKDGNLRVVWPRRVGFPKRLVARTRTGRR